MTQNRLQTKQLTAWGLVIAAVFLLFFLFSFGDSILTGYAFARKSLLLKDRLTQGAGIKALLDESELKSLFKDPTPALQKTIELVLLIESNAFTEALNRTEYMRVVKHKSFISLVTTLKEAKEIEDQIKEAKRKSRPPDVPLPPPDNSTEEALGDSQTKLAELKKNALIFSQELLLERLMDDQDHSTISRYRFVQRNLAASDWLPALPTDSNR